MAKLILRIDPLSGSPILVKAQPAEDVPIGKIFVKQMYVTGGENKKLEIVYDE